MSVDKKVLDSLYKHRDYFPAQLKYKLRLRMGKARSPHLLSNADSERMREFLAAYLEQGFPALYPSKFDCGRWIGSGQLPVSASTPVIGFAREGKIITADFFLIKPDEYPAIIAGIKAIDREEFVRRMDAHLRDKCKRAWKSEYLDAADDLRVKSVNALEFFQNDLQ